MTKIQDGEFKIPEYVKEDARDLINKLLMPCPEDRLGAGADLDNNIQALKDHEFFKGVNFQALGKPPLDPMTECLSPTKRKLIHQLPKFSKCRTEGPKTPSLLISPLKTEVSDDNVELLVEAQPQLQRLINFDVPAFGESGDKRITLLS